MKDLKHYQQLSELFKYPDSGFLEKMDRCEQLMKEHYSNAASEFSVFSSYMKNATIDEREEIYTKTFDVQPICYLDLGYVIFGEDYKRGAFLLHMQTEQKKLNNDCGSDLPDNIANVFTLISKSNDTDFISELVSDIIIPAVKKIIAEFESARIELKLQVLKKLHKAVIQENLNQGNVYKNCFNAILLILQSDFPEQKKSEDQERNAVLESDHHHSFFKKSTIN
ncbi:MAG: hypothetical protein JNL24_09555 [Bacteroidia bacterium]|nr:hypothetical protein [Bacteroidia bacterium]